MKLSSPFWISSGIAIASLVACSDGPSGPAMSAATGSESAVDPAPTAPGIFLGDAVAPVACTDGTQPDSDRDALADACENALAAAFAPDLAYSSTDRTTREPRWAARPLGSGKVRLAYLLSLHFDPRLLSTYPSMNFPAAKGGYPPPSWRCGSTRSTARTPSAMMASWGSTSAGRTPIGEPLRHPSSTSAVAPRTRPRRTAAAVPCSARAGRWSATGRP